MPSSSLSSIEVPIKHYQEIFKGLKMRELKDQLCTLLLTFQDEKDPQSREITAAHTFTSIKPEDYPQHRRVVHSRHSDRDEFGKLLSTTDCLSQSSLASPCCRQLGSDMVEHRRVFSSPPYVAISVHPPNSLAPFEMPSSAMSGQMMHHTNTSGSSASPMASGGSLISVHEVSLTYTRSSFENPFVDSFSPQIATSKLPSKKGGGGELVTTFPSSGSVHVHLGSPLSTTMDKGRTKLLPYTVSRPQADWAFQRAGEQVQISDQHQNAPKTRAHESMAQQQPSRMSVVGINIHRPTGSRNEGGEMSQQQRRGEAGTSSPTAADSPRSRSPPPKMPAQPPPFHSSTGLPVLSHRQRRSFESNEQSSMLEQRGKSKSKTVFQKTTCELRSEKSVTTFGRTSKSGTTPSTQTIIAPKSTSKQIPVVQGRGLPRHKHAADQAMDAHLYTRYDDPTKQRKIGRGGEMARLVEEEHSREEFTRIAKPSKTATPTIVFPPFGSPPQIRRDSESRVPSKFGGHEIQKPRLIDFATYKREVEELQRQASAINQSAEIERKQTELPAVPLSPAIVLKRPKEKVELPKAQQEPTLETTIKYFAREEFMEHRKREAKSDEMMPSDEELKRVDEERQRREMEEVERRRIEEEQRIREEKRRFNEAQKLRKEAEEEEARKRAAAAADEEKERRRKERPKQSQQLQMMKATTAEVYQTVEVISRIPSTSPHRQSAVDQTQISSRMAKLEEQIQLVPSVPMAMIEMAVPVEVAREQRTEEMSIQKEGIGGCEKEEVKDEVEEEVQSKPLEPPVDYDMELDTSDMGKRLFEHLRRELQYEEEIDTEVRRRRRQREEGGGEEEEEETERIVDSDEGTVRRLPSTEEEVEEEEVESEEVEMIPTTAEEPTFTIWREQLDAGSSGMLSPRHAPKVSMSGELPPLLEEEEEQPSFEEKVEVVTSDEDSESTVIISTGSSPIPPPASTLLPVYRPSPTMNMNVDTTTTSSTIQTRRKPPPPIPPPKPPHSTHFGVGPPPERSRIPSWSSAYSNVYPPTTSPAYTMEYSPASSDYRSAISARQHYARPMRPLSPIQGSYGGKRVLKMVSETSSVSSRPISPYPGSTAAVAIRDAREREKKEMSDLNDRLANYIEKVRFLEAQNRKLAADLDFLRNRWGRDTANVRDMFEGDLKQARKLIAESQGQRDELERKASAMAEEMAELRRKNDNAFQAHDDDKERMEELLLKLAALESELAALKRRLAILEEDVKSLKRENGRLSAELQRAKTDLDQETLNRIDYQNQVQTLLEEVDFLRRAHDQEIQDLQAMASRDTTQENREMFRNELASAMRDIREDYERVNSRNRTDIESWYKLKVQEIQTQSARQSMEQGYAKEEVRRLRTQLGDLRGKLADLEGKNSLLEKQAEDLAYQLEDDQRASESALNERDAQIRKMRDECQALMVELQMLLDTKQTLDAEIAIYRKMLEGEEDRAGLRQLVEQVVRTHQIRQSDESESTRVLRGEKSSRQSYQRSAKGNVSILEVSPEGKYVVLENSHRSKEEPIGEWKLKRQIDGRREIVYTFPRDFVLRPGKIVKVWAKNQGGIHFPPDQLIFDGEDTFGVGSNVQTLLYNRDGEERASLIQRSSGASANRQ